MKKIILLLFSAFTFFSCTEKKSTDTAKNNNTVPKVNSKVDELVKKYIDLDIFSGVVIIAQDGKPFYQKAFGLANREKNIPNTLNTKFVIGSMNKTFTHTLILQLIIEGKISLQDKLVNYLDGFQQKDADKITIAQLVNHTSGFGDYHNEDYWQLKFSDKNIKGILEILKKMDLLFPPGSQDEYSNAGYIILGAIIEKVTGKSYAQNVVERIAHPLNLKTLVVSDVKQIPNRAIGYLKTINGIEDNEKLITEPRSDGGFYATAEDILRFYREYLYGDLLISPELRKQDDFFKRIAHYYKEPGKGIPIAGGFNGANTVHLEMLADGISIVVFANMDEPVAEKIASGILKIIAGEEAETPTLPAKLNVYEAFKKKGIDYVKNNFEQLTQSWHPADPKDLLLNNLGYELMAKEQLEDALSIFKLNTVLFPNIGNVWDSYGEALLKNGDKKAALEAYKKAIAINPKIPSAKKMVNELEK